MKIDVNLKGANWQALGGKIEPPFSVKSVGNESSN
jgi:hypothetical protein